MTQNEIIQEFITYLKYPHRILKQDFTREQITKFYRQEFARGQKEGFTPVLIKVDDILADYLNAVFQDDNYQPEQALQNLPDGKEILNLRWEDAVEYGEPDNNDENYRETLDTMDCAGQDVFISLHDNDKMELTLLFEIPTVSPWEIPAYVPFGGWNDCPSPEEMTAVCKYWYEQYQAVPAVISHDTLEMILPEPVPEEKINPFGREYYAFCQDTIEQGLPLPLLKEVLRQSEVWYFWWD